MPDAPGFLLMRHGRCRDNIAGRLPRRSEPLDETGVLQSLAAADALVVGEHRPAKVVSSALFRARTTGALIADRLSISASVDERLDEMDFGLAEGLTTEEFDRRFPEHSRRIADETDPAFAWPGGESRSAFFDRISSFISDARSLGALPLVVTHWTVSGVLRAAVQHGSVRQWTRFGLDPGNYVPLPWPSALRTSTRRLEVSA